MRALILAAACAAAGTALAGDLVLKNKESGQQLRLLDSQCSHGETMAILKEEWRPKFKNARILNEKGFIEWYGCWIEQEDGDLIVILQDGSAIELPKSVFTDPTV